MSKGEWRTTQSVSRKNTIKVIFQLNLNTKGQIATNRNCYRNVSCKVVEIFRFPVKSFLSNIKWVLNRRRPKRTTDDAFKWSNQIVELICDCFEATRWCVSLTLIKNGHACVHQTCEDMLKSSNYMTILSWLSQKHM